MKFSLTSLKISIAGAKLSHLVQKDKAWDHGSMSEQARIIFYLVQKANANGNIQSLKKHCSVSCFEKLGSEELNKQKILWLIKPVIKEIAIVDVQPGKNNRPDMFRTLIKGMDKNGKSEHDILNEFTAKCSFVRQGEWWLLDEIRIKNF